MVLISTTPQRLNYDCELILFDDLDLKKQSRFCNADIVIVDCSVKEQCVNLFYTLSGNADHFIWFCFFKFIIRETRPLFRCTTSCSFYKYNWQICQPIAFGALYMLCYHQKWLNYWDCSIKCKLVIFKAFRSPYRNSSILLIQKTDFNHLELSPQWGCVGRWLTTYSWCGTETPTRPLISRFACCSLFNVLLHCLKYWTV